MYLCIPRTQLTSVFEGQPSPNKAFSKPKQRSPFGSPQSSHLPRMMARSRFWSFQPIKLSGPSSFSTSNKVFFKKTCYWKPNPPGFQTKQKETNNPFIFFPQTPWVSTLKINFPHQTSKFWLAKRKTPNLYHLKTLTW